jgi:O-glycosyl hydrolase
VRPSRITILALLLAWLPAGCQGTIISPPHAAGDTEVGAPDGGSGDPTAAGDPTAGDPTAEPCRNGSLDPGEDCDTDQLDDHECSDLGFAAGVLACADNCRFDTSGCTSAGAEITIDRADQRQTIDGFGFFGPMRFWWNSTHASDFYTDAWLEMIIADLGITIWRNEYYSEESNQDADWAEQSPMVSALAAKAAEHGVDLKLIMTVWTPPSAWKDNGSLKDGGHLEAQYYDEFGQWLVTAADNHAALGIDLYGISPQNEPLFVEDYNSCIYTQQEYVDMMQVVGPIVHDAYPNLKIFGPEHMLFGVARDWDWDHLDPSQPTLEDSEAGAHLDLWACHGYGADGVTPGASSDEAAYWTTARQRIGAYGKRRWMTETSGYGSDWDGVLDYVMSIHAALYYGEVSAWVHWYGAGDLVTETSLTKAGHAAKHYFRYVRPGAVALHASSSDADVLATAFEHTGDGTVAVVLINAANSASTVSLSGSGLPAEFQAYRTSRSEDHADIGTVSSGSVTLTARSITTLYHAQP